MRSSGVFMSIRSLPSPGGVGTLGQEAREFVSWLANAGFTIWHIPPVCPVEEGITDYLSLSCGDPLLLDMRMLHEEGYLSQPPEDFAPYVPENRQVLVRAKRAALKQSFQENRKRLSAELDEFTADHDEVRQYALFMAVRKYFGEKPWYEWSDLSIVLTEENALAYYRRILAEDIKYFVYLQYLFDRQWTALKTYANEKGVKLMCELPFYPMENSCDVWAHPELFMTGRNHRVTRMAASAPSLEWGDGSLWNRPAYNWKEHEKSGFAWWLQRFSLAEKRYDIVRLEHFNSFASCYCVKAGAENARVGTHEKVPGRALFSAVRKQMPDFPFVADNTDGTTFRSKMLLRFCGFTRSCSLVPRRGSGDGNLSFMNDVEENTALFSSTHQTAETWWDGCDDDTRRIAQRYLPVRGKISQSLTEAALGSMANIAIVPMRDLAGLSDAICPPGAWQLPKNALTQAQALDARNMNEFFQRIPSKENE